MEFNFLKAKTVNLKNYASRAGKNLNWLFIFIFFLIVLLEFWQINNSLQIIINLSRDTETVTKEKGVRIDFSNYQKVTDKINTGKVYEPEGLSASSTSPFFLGK